MVLFLKIYGFIVYFYYKILIFRKSPQKKISYYLQTKNLDIKKIFLFVIDFYYLMSKILI